MQRINRRNLLHVGIALAMPWTAILQIGCLSKDDSRAGSTNEFSGDQSAVEDKNTDKGNTMQVHYLEIVTPTPPYRAAFGEGRELSSLMAFR